MRKLFAGIRKRAIGDRLFSERQIHQHNSPSCDPRLPKPLHHYSQNKNAAPPIPAKHEAFLSDHG
jgi:hypothetical protein